MDSVATTIKKLEQAKRAIDVAINALSTLAVKEPKEQFAVGYCWVCGEPIKPDDSTTREAHTGCYNRWYKRFVGPGKQYPSTDAAENDGALPPKRKPGRKPSQDLDELLRKTKKRIRGD